MWPCELDCYIHFLEQEGHAFCEGNTFNREEAWEKFEEHVRKTNSGMYYLDYEEICR